MLPNPSVNLKISPGVEEGNNHCTLYTSSEKYRLGRYKSLGLWENVVSVFGVRIELKGALIKVSILCWLPPKYWQTSVIAGQHWDNFCVISNGFALQFWFVYKRYILTHEVQRKHVELLLPTNCMALAFHITMRYHWVPQMMPSSIIGVGLA